MLVKLIDMARDRSGDSRRELFHAVSDLFVEGAERYSDREVILFGEVLSQLLAKAALDDRRLVAEQVATVRRTPRDLALQLAEDEHPVAAPILEHAHALTEDDLATIASAKDEPYRVAIARRSGLPESITDILVDRGGNDVLQTVTENKTARFSGRGMSVLAEKAVNNRRLAETLAERADLTPAVVDTIIKLLSPAAAKNLAQLVGRGSVEQVVEAATHNMTMVVDDAKRQRAEALQMSIDIKKRVRNIDEALTVLIAQKRVLDIALVMSELAGVAESHVANAIEQRNVTAVTMVFRAMDVAPETFASLVRMRAERLQIPKAEGDAAVKDYRDMQRATAERALRFHQARHSKGGKR